MSKFLKLNSLSKKYEKNKTLRVLNNINFKFEAGKVYSITGPSGSGKSTLLNILSLIDIPSSGFIEFNKNILAIGCGDFAVEVTELCRTGKNKLSIKDFYNGAQKLLKEGDIIS